MAQTRIYVDETLSPGAQLVLRGEVKARRAEVLLSQLPAQLLSFGLSLVQLVSKFFLLLFDGRGVLLLQFSQLAAQLLTGGLSLV